MTRTSQRGFTLIEILLVVLLVAILAGTGLRLPYLLAPNRAHDTDVFAVVTALYRSQTLAASGRGDSAWGVHIASASTTVFRGDSYDTRDERYDEATPLESSLALTGPSDIVFSRGTAWPDAAATLSLQFGVRTASVSINPYGVIDFRYVQ
jgi:prepilin-type N-terminal cleavage/methylation domain-containing protein